MSAQIIPLTELRDMPQKDIAKINKDVLIASIRASRDDEAALLNHALQRKVDEIFTELRDMKNQISSPESSINRKLTQLQAQVDKQAEIISRQQSFLESVDRKERETRLVVLGVPDEQESLDGETTDEGKLQKVWHQLSETPIVESIKRLGRDGTGGRKRPILVTLPSRSARDKLLSKSNRLKEAGGPYGRIYVKKDVHPSIRNEWKRLRDVETAEKARPENVGCVVRLDTRERKVYRDNVVIDSWNSAPLF